MVSLTEGDTSTGNDFLETAPSTTLSGQVLLDSDNIVELIPMVIVIFQMVA